ncbi:molecular chaperone [Saxophila tyrrhenica]|uniref:Molecular chaperone n=1 Tax=Saxophila tyrrhenica TaxID=1690608 RepID=A0AAV9PL15_9PEZI|nr:molecular chaperone [Saxophila tyrrhenica]
MCRLQQHPRRPSYAQDARGPPFGGQHTITPLRRQEASATEPPPPQRESILPQTHFDFFPNTFPNGPPPKSPFTPDLQALRREFLQIQAKSHPDMAPANQKRQAEALSSRVNEAYKAIQDPLKRAQYLLSLRGIDVEDESAKLAENELLMEVMEAREAVDEVESEEELGSIRDENNARIGQSVEVLEKAFAKDEMERAAQEAIRLRYWMNIEESIHGWEKGKGGGVIHH